MTPEQTMAHRPFRQLITAAMVVAAISILLACSEGSKPVQPGGVMYSQDDGLTWQASDLTGKWVAAVARDWSSEGHAFAAIQESEGIELWHTTNGGAHWSRLGSLPNEAGTVAHDIVAVQTGAQPTLLVGTPHGLWLSDDRGKTWRQQADLGDHAAWRLAALEDAGHLRMFVSLAVPDDESVGGLYSSTDLMSWRKEAGGAFLVFESFDRASVLAVNEQDIADQGTVFRADGESKLGLPMRPTDVAGAFVGRGSMLAAALGGVYVSDDDGASWSKVADAGGQLAAAPDFLRSRVMLVGGFRTGLFRSSDGGATWQTVVDDPSTVVPGANELSVAFLSRGAAIATNLPSGHEIK